MSRPTATTPRTLVFAIGTVVLAALCLPLAALARPRARPDLVERAIGTPPTRLVPGGSFGVGDTVLNRGRTRAKRSTTRYYLRAGRVALLVGARRIPPLGASTSSLGHAVLRVSGGAHAGRYSLVVCADAARSVRESNERNNCRTARRRVAVSPIATGGPPSPGPGPSSNAVDSDGDGFPDNLDCAPRDPSIHPGAPDAPDLKFVDSNCDGINGDASRAIFVSPNGDDANPGTQIHPKRTLASAVSAGDARGKDVYATAGTYTELLEVNNRVGVYGGYSSDWTRRGLAATRITGATTVSGGTAGAAAFNITSPTTLQLLSLPPARRASRAAAPTACAASIAQAYRSTASLCLPRPARTALPARTGPRGDPAATAVAAPRVAPGQAGRVPSGIREVQAAA